MESELKCSYCNDFFCNPVLLPCFHSLCYTCALHLQEKFNTTTIVPTTAAAATPTTKTLTTNAFANAAKSITALSSSISPSSSSSSSSSSSCDDDLNNTTHGSSGNFSSTSIISDLDKLSILSETDSGVTAMSCYSRPCSSYIQQQQPPPLPSTLYSTYLPCPKCSTMIYMDETGCDSLTKNTCLENIVERYTDAKKISLKCQMCPKRQDDEDEEKDAVYMCEQCEIYYCDECREAFHPQRGPLLKHTLVAPRIGRDLIKKRNRTKESKCLEHFSESVSLYCLVCKAACCGLCVTDNSAHLNHQIQQINVFCKSQKAELSQILQSLSGKAKAATEFVTKLKNVSDLIEDNSSQIKTICVTEIDEMIRLLEQKKKELVDFINMEKASKIKSVKDQVSHLSTRIQKTTGLLQFGVETLKEQDPSSFLQISEHMITRMSDIEHKFPTPTEPKCELDFDFMLNSDAIYKEIKKLNYKQLKVPSPPTFIAEECSTDPKNSTIILSWQQTTKNNAQGYVLEIDDGTHDSSFKQVYCGPDRICQINGLVSNSIYNARVRAYNQAGYSDYSPTISQAASPSLWFSFSPKTSHPDVHFSNNFMTASSGCFEDRVILGSLGFSKGLHYWEISVDRYDNQPDPAFGVARYDTAKDHMLGKDAKSWCMYIDAKRSWFMHAGKHVNRIDSGCKESCVIGILLDLNNFQLSYFVNDEPHGGVAFSKLPQGVYYPAFSLNKNVQITISSGLEPPMCLDHSDDSD